MRNFVIILFTIMYLFSQSLKAQNEEAAAAAAAVAVGAGIAIGTGIAAVKHMEERAELQATQWILLNEPNLTSFSLKTLSFDGKKLKDMSEASVIIYKIQEFTPVEKPILNGKKYVLFGFTSQGWINQFGIDFNKIQWFLVDNDEWLRMMTAYVKVSSNIKDESKLNEYLMQGKVVNNGVRVKGKMAIPFFKLEDDMYVVTDFSMDLRLVYNERSLGVFLKKTGDLAQIKRGDIIDIHNYFFDE